MMSDVYSDLALWNTLRVFGKLQTFSCFCALVYMIFFKPQGHLQDTIHTYVRTLSCNVYSTTIHISFMISYYTHNYCYIGPFSM